MAGRNLGGHHHRGQHGRHGHGDHGPRPLGPVAAVRWRKPNNCCYSRLGRAKARYQSRADAEEKCRDALAKRGHHVEVYECTVHKGTFHLRRVRL